MLSTIILFISIIIGLSPLQSAVRKDAPSPQIPKNNAITLEDIITQEAQNFCTTRASNVQHRFHGNVCFLDQVSVLPSKDLLANTINPVSSFDCQTPDLSGTTTLGGNVQIDGDLTVTGNVNGNSGSGQIANAIACGLIVDKDADPVYGSTFNTIQGALDYIGKPVNLADQRIRWVIVVCGGAYDEDLAIPSARLICILAFGAVTLGDGTGVLYQSTTPRSITWTVNQADEFSTGDSAPRPTLKISTLFPSETSSTHVAYIGGFDVSGDFTIVNPGGVGQQTTHEMHLYGVKVRGDFDSTGDFGILNTYIRRCFFDQTHNSPNGNLNIVESTEFDGLITCATYGRILDCQIQGGMTTSSGPNSFLPPTGFVNTCFGGTFTGPGASSLLLDGNTNYHFKANGASLAGGATKVIQTDLVA